jgi:hypothetical protein
MKTTVEMAKEAGVTWEPIGNIIGPLERFEALVRAAEREACAKVCDKRYMGDNNREDIEAKRCAAAIRARSQA